MTTYTNTQEPLADPFCPIPLSQCCKYHNGENTTIMSQDVQVCRKCGVIFDLNIRKNKDCYAVPENIQNSESMIFPIPNNQIGSYLDRIILKWL